MIRRETIVGPCRLLLGDCMEILPSLGKFDAVVTDPPFGIYVHGGKWGKKESLQWDRKPVNDLVECILAHGEDAIVWGGNYYAFPPSRGWLVWYKRDSVPSAADVEMAWTSLDMNARLIDQTIAATNAERNGHPTLKPLRVMRWSLSFLPDAEEIIDPFAGSGTTGVAAIMEGKSCTLIEREEKYYDIAVRRCREAWGDGSLFDEKLLKEPPALFDEVAA